MPRCTKQELIIKPTSLEGYRDNEEVFYCGTTNEIFRDYEEYFRRIMLINSTIWACEVTGRENLTYAEALESEKKASEKGKGLREVLKAPILLLTKMSQQSSYYELCKLLYQFFKEQYLKGEIVMLADSAQRYKYEIIDVIKPKDANIKHTNSSESTSSSSSTSNSTSSSSSPIKYKLKRIDKKGLETKNIIVTVDQMKRLQSDYSFDRLNCFLKENTQLIDGIIYPKDNIYKKHIIDHNITFQKLYVCELPQWKPKKKLSEKKEKLEKRDSNSNHNKINSNENNYNNNDGSNNNKKKKISETDAKDKKQKTLSQYLVKTNNKNDNTENMKNLMIEMERIRKEREAKQLELEKKKAEMNMKAEQEATRILTKCDDLERDDQKPLPLYKPVKSIVSNKYFGDLLMIQEFLHSFSPILSIHDVFSNNVTFHQMCRALTVREVAGPLSDIIQVLLSTIFSFQIEEDDECSIEYRNPIKATAEPQITVNRATKTHFFVNKHYSHKIHELPIDALTLSELLRLHLLSSGAATTEKCTKWRFMYRNGYSNTEDPGLLLRMKQPHILRALKSYSIYQLPFDDIIKIIKCLIDQILTYQTTISLLEEREEKLTKLRQKIKNLYLTENKRILLSTNKKKNLTNEYNLKANETTDLEEKKKIMNELSLKIAKVIQEDEKEKKEYEYQLSEARSQVFDHIINLGMDRCYRQYFIFESICGLFIEHPIETFDDKCLDKPPQNCIELSDLPRIRHKLKSFFLQRFKEMEKENNSIKNSNTKSEKTTSGESNKENSRINGVLNKNITTVVSNSVSSTTTSTVENGCCDDDVKIIEYGPKPYNPSQYELYMCTGDPNNCIVHNSKDPNRYQWTYIHSQEDLENIIDALNTYGKRESALKEQLITYKSLILKHITNCPINDLSVGEKITKEKFLNQIKLEKRYLNANFGYHIGYNGIDEILYNTLLDKILQFENDISRGHLGKLKVKDIEKWRCDLQNNAYDSQCENLIYGIKDETISSATKTNITTDIMINDFEDPGDGLGNTTEIISEDSSSSDNEDDLLPSHNSPETQKLVQNLASALLQIEQAIEQKFLKEPFGIKNEVKDKEVNETRLSLGRTKLKNWESSLMKSTNYSQIFLHLNIIVDAVKWTKSSNHARCIKCRKKSLPEQMLLCDECNAGMHMFCMEPKLDSIPKGNWYCKKCTVKLGLENKVEQSTKKKKKVFKIDDDDDDENETSNSEEDSNDEEIEEEEEEENEEKDDDDDGDENNSSVDSDVPPRKSKTKTRKGRGRKKNVISDDETENKDEEKDYDDDDENNSVTDSDIPPKKSKKQTRKGRGRKKNVISDDESEEEVVVNGKAKSYVNDEISSEDDKDDEDSEVICKVCGFGGSDIMCHTCSSWYHLECTDLRRIPRGTWECNQCKNKVKTKEKNFKRKFEEDDILSDSTESEESDEPQTKRGRHQNQQQPQTETRNLRKRSNNYDNNNKKSNGINSRRSRYYADNSLPLNSIILYDLLDGIMKHEDSWPFLRPVLLSQVPDYYDVIKKPMDFGQIKSNLNLGKYRENQEVINDIELVFKNCDLYNTEGNDIYRAGKSLELFVYKKCKELKLPYKPSDMISSEVKYYNGK